VKLLNRQRDERRRRNLIISFIIAPLKFLSVCSHPERLYRMPVDEMMEDPGHGIRNAGRQSRIVR
jgi:hypothetical protein